MFGISLLRPALAQRGGVLVELAAVLPVLILLSLGTLEFASALSEYRVILNQTRIAARYLAAMAPGQGHDVAKCITSHGIQSSPPCSGGAILPGLGAATVTIEDASSAPATHRAQPVSATTGSVTVNLVTVKVSGYSHPLITGNIISGILDQRTSITFGPISTTMRQAL